MTDDISTDDAPLATSKTSGNGAALADDFGVAERAAVTGQSVTINRPVNQLFAYFRDFGNLATFMENVVRIAPVDNHRSHWVVKAPAGATVEWDARITDEVADRLIAWESEPGADVANSGRIEFLDAGARGTVVTATIMYDPPAGIVGKLLAKMFQREPAIQARRDLRRFKQLMETGEIATNAMNRDQFEEQDA